MKKVLSIMLCVVLILSMSVTAFAAEPTYTLTINNPTKDHTYEAYQIFSGKLEKISGTDIEALTDIKWGSAIVGEDYDHSAALLTEIQAAATAAKDDAPIKKLLGVTTAAALAEAMADNITSDSETLDTLAAIFAKYVKADSKIGTQAYTENMVEEDGKTVDKSYYTLSGLPAGYYLVKDAEDSLTGKYDSYTRFILRVVKNTNVSPKSGVPAIEKEISDQLHDNYGESKDFDINDDVYYKWVGHLPSNLSSYKDYHYKFYDTLPKGIRFDRFEQIYLVDKDNNVVYTWLDMSDTNDANDTLPAGVYETHNENDNGTTSITLEFANLIALYPDILADQKIVVKYSAFVTRDAVMAQPMTNTVFVEYDNDPNHSGDGHYGRTPEDDAHAFTFGINVDKYDTDNKDVKLPGAQFILYYTKAEKNEETGKTENVNYYAKVITKAFLEENPDYELNGRVISEADRGVVYGWDKNVANASTLTTNEKGEILLRGLDAGIYYLKETEAPAGYNLMETPVKVEIAPTYDKDGQLVSVEYKVDDIKQETNTVGVRNSSGSTLPVTGGMGTTLFYILGSILFVGAAILLIAKKRMRAEA